MNHSQMFSPQSLKRNSYCMWFRRTAHKLSDTFDSNSKMEITMRCALCSEMMQNVLKLNASVNVISISCNNGEYLCGKSIRTTPTAVSLV